jgi:fibronectin type III domain protein
MRYGRRAGRFVVAAVTLLAFVVCIGTAAAASPSAATGPTTAVGSSSATVTGTVNPGGNPTTWYVEYGGSTSYGSKTQSASAGSGATATGVSVALNGLKPGTTYHYRVVATNGAGTSRGQDAVFTTLVPPVASTSSASSVSTSSATLNGSVDANGRTTSFWFEYGTTTSYGSKTDTRSAGSSTSPQGVSFPISGLQPGHSYHYRLVAQSDAGSSAGKDVSFTTSSAPAVATGGATAVAPTSATLTGTVTANGLSTTWWFEYGTTTAYGSRTSTHGVGSGTGAHPISAGISRLKAATTYHYRLVARNSSGTVAGADQSFATIGPPASQTGPTQSVGADTAVVSGVLDTHGRATTWWFDYGTSTSYGRSTSAKSAASNAGSQTVSIPITGLGPATVYHYRLVVKSDAGTTAGSDATFTTAGVSLTVPVREVAFGGRIRLTGTVPTGQAGEQVIIFAQPYGGGSFHSVSTVITGAGGAWEYLASPAIATAYAANWRGGMSAAVTVGVRPVVTVRRTRTGRIVVHVAGGRSFAYRVVLVQKRVNGHWTTVRRVRLGARSRAEFRLALRRGRTTLRAAISVNQVGVGYLGSASRPLTFTVRR